MNKWQVTGVFVMNWDHLRFLIAIADQGSVSRAAQQSEVSHATVLRAVKRMESDLGTRLFDHLRTGYRLTAAGEAVLEKAREIESLVGDIHREQKGLDQVPAGELRIAIPDASVFNLMPLLNEFNRRHSQINLKLVTASLVKPEDLLAQQLDAMLSVTSEPPEDLVGRQISRLEFVPVIKDKNGKPDWIKWQGVTDDSETQEMQQKMMSRVRNSRVIMTTSSHEQALQAVRAGIGMACLSREVLYREPDLHLWTGLQGAAAQRIGLWVLTHPDLRSSGRVMAFLRFFSDS